MNSDNGAHLEKGGWVKKISQDWQEIRQQRKVNEANRKSKDALDDARLRLNNWRQQCTEKEGDQMSSNENEQVIKSPFIAIRPSVTLEDGVVLSEQTRMQLDEGIAKLKFHKIIYEDWNFGAIDKQGRSVILNFFGAPGTGKTLTAEAFAGSLGMPIIKVGIAELESKFMGETSKNIQNVFRAALELNAVLFFDEADTLLGKRLSSVTQGIDNEVNAMRSTLLIELEKFSGIAIFATNFAKNYDEAFRSRISHHIHFDLPDLNARQKIWSKMLVDQIPLATSKEELVEMVAQLSEGFSGREIRTCMRLVLPKVLLEAEQSQEEPKVKLAQVQEVIERIKKAKYEVASTNKGEHLSNQEMKAAKSLLGVSN